LKSADKFKPDKSTSQVFRNFKSLGGVLLHLWSVFCPEMQQFTPSKDFKFFGFNFYIGGFQFIGGERNIEMSRDSGIVGFPNFFVIIVYIEELNQCLVCVIFLGCCKFCDQRHSSDHQQRAATAICNNDFHDRQAFRKRFGKKTKKKP
jgi:hypothetical protein